MFGATEEARETFKYFWREMAWESRRIVPACSVAAVKMALSDDGDLESPDVEHMWVREVGFDGRSVVGVLLNQPRGLRSVKAGDVVQQPFARVEDWLYAIEGKAYGAFTVNLMRQSMSPEERAQHDGAWGLDFGDPESIELVPAGWFEDPENPEGQHPMSANMAPELAKAVAADPSFLTSTDPRGFTMLHDQALAGSLPTVEVLLAAGADPRLETPDGRTALHLAEDLDWVPVVAALQRAMAH
ncbi:MAG: hypothetical protein CMN30_24610 [Sandaracinus sp.]|nr:hypothetical protein [Sandaracinus sp.]